MAKNKLVTDTIICENVPGGWNCSLFRQLIESPFVQKLVLLQEDLIFKQNYTTQCNAQDNLLEKKNILRVRNQSENNYLKKITNGEILK